MECFNFIMWSWLLQPRHDKRFRKMHFFYFKRKSYMQGVFDFLGMSTIINYPDILYWEDVKDLLELLLKFTLIIPFQVLGVNL